MSRSRPASSDDEDRILWATVARSVTPLYGHRQPEFPPPARAATQTEPILSAPNPPQRPSQRERPPVPQPLDRPTHDKLAAGRIVIGGRVDLHGLTQHEAHRLLLGFLSRAHANGMRHVLVITGKGTSSGGDGVLRRAVPSWLATPPFSHLVSGHSPAARNHGGEGALYLRLRRVARR